MNQRIVFLIGFPALWIVVWGLIGAASSGIRPPLPGVELPILAVAWDMWQRDAFIIPGIQGSSTGFVFPLYPWLVQGVWALFGVSDIWPRMAPSALGLGCTFMIAALCRAIWPGWSGLGALGATLATGMVGWMVFASVSGGQMLLMLCILVALYGIMATWRRGIWAGVIPTGFGLGLGFLTDGVSVLIAVLPVALLAPVWAPALGWAADREGDIPVAVWRPWYVRLALSLVIGVAIVAAWFAAIGMEAGGSVAGQLALESLGVMRQGVGQVGPHWWRYLLALGLFVFPWIVWPPAWRALGGAWPLVKDGGGLFCLIWLLPPVVLSTVLSGGAPITQLADSALHVPPLAMIAAYLLYLRIDPEMARQETERRFGNGEATLGIVIALMGLVLIVAPLAGGLISLPWWIAGLSGSWGVVLIAFAAATAYAAPRLVIFRAALVMSQMALVVLVGMLAASPLLFAQADILPAASHLRQALNHDIAVAFAGAYRNDLDFPARLERPLDHLDPEDSIGVVAWAAGHEGGQIAVVIDQLPTDRKAAAVFPYLGQYLAFWPVEIIAEQPDIVVRPTSTEYSAAQ